LIWLNTGPQAGKGMLQPFFRHPPQKNVGVGSTASFQPPTSYFRSTPSSRHFHRSSACLKRAKQWSDGRISLIDSTAFTSRARPQTALKRVRAKVNFVSRFNLVWVVGSSRAKIPLSENQKICILPAVLPRQEGRTRRHERGAGCGGRGGGARRAAL